MANSILIFMFLFIAGFSSLVLVHSFDFDVGDSIGWVVPPQNDTKFFNDWASENRFLIHDTLRFRYKKDSVMDVSESDYKKCNSTRPISFSNTGNTVIELGRSGLFYFISGASGHCQRGQKMIVRVMSEQEDGRRHSSAAVSSTVFHGGLLPALVLSYYFIISKAAA